MRKLQTVIKNELYRYFTSPLAYVYLISFLLLNSSFAFYFGGFFSKGQSDLYSMFAFQPWLYLIFIPGISMRLWAEEFRTKTIIQIVTTPISISTLVWGKFFAAWIFCGISLALTFPFWISVNILGQPDNTVIFVAYLASFFLAGSILSISSAMSAITKNQVIALVLSFFATILFFLSGLEFILSFFRVFAPVSIVDMVASFSFLTHFDTMAKGSIELRDIVFFASIIALFNILTTLIVSFKTSGTSKVFKSNNLKFYFLTFTIFLIGFIGLNLTANSLFRNIQYDATEEKLFTLTPSTIKILEELPRKTIIKLYYSPILGERNHEIRLMFDRTRILLNKYVNHSNGKIDYKIYNPKFLDRIEDEALNNNLQPIPVIDINQNGFFGMSFSDELDNKISIPFFAQERQNFVEQDISQKIYELYHKKKTVGILTTLQMGDTKISENVVSTKWAILDTIQELYDVKFIEKAEDIENIDVLMIIHPQKLSKEIVEKIKIFSQMGGKFFIALDGADEASRIYSFAPGEFFASNLSGLDEFWGFKTYTNWVIADLDNSITVDATDNYQTNPTFSQDIIQLRYSNNAFNPKLPEVATLQSLMFSSVSPITPTSDKIVFIPLIIAGENSQLMPMKVIYDNLTPNKILNLFEKDENTKIVAARILGETIENPFELIVVGDTDFLYDSFWGKKTSVLNQSFMIPIMDNANFVMNALDTLTEDTNLIDLRGRAAKYRKFEDIEKIRRFSQREFATKEAEILEKINQTKVELEELTNKRNFEQREEFNVDELAILSKIRKKLDTLRQELSDTRLQSNDRLKKIETFLKVINIYSVPLIILLIILLRKLRTERKTHKSKQKMIFSKEFRNIALFSSILLIAGISSTYLTDRREIDRYENKFIFEDLNKHINNIESFSIKNHENELVFYKENNVWKLKGYEDFPVYQERVKNLFITLMDARYYEKKSDKAENLEKFGLSPIEEKASRNTRIELFEAGNKKILGLEVGKYNMDIGRGAKAAYVKFDNKFQVWLASVEFIDLSTDWQNWTYSTVWNLRFGRLTANHGKAFSDKDKAALMVRDLLNSSFDEKAMNKASNGQKTTLLLSSEDGDEITLNIYQNKNKYYVSYNILTPIQNKSLAFFYETAQGKTYEISTKDKGKIENVLTLIK